MVTRSTGKDRTIDMLRSLVRVLKMSVLNCSSQENMTSVVWNGENGYYPPPAPPVFLANREALLALLFQKNCTFIILLVVSVFHHKESPISRPLSMLQHSGGALC